MKAGHNQTVGGNGLLQTSTQQCTFLLTLNPAWTFNQERKLAESGPVDRWTAEQLDRRVEIVEILMLDVKISGEWVSENLQGKSYSKVL